MPVIATQRASTCGNLHWGQAMIKRTLKLIQVKENPSNLCIHFNTFTHATSEDKLNFHKHPLNAPKLSLSELWTTLQAKVWKIFQLMYADKSGRPEATSKQWEWPEAAHCWSNKSRLRCWHFGHGTTKILAQWVLLFLGPAWVIFLQC